VLSLLTLKLKSVHIAETRSLVYYLNEKSQTQDYIFFAVVLLLGFGMWLLAVLGPLLF